MDRHTLRTYSIFYCNNFRSGAYYIPYVYNFLDTIEAPVALMAGTLAMVAIVNMKWSLSVIMGGSVASVTQLIIK